MRSGLFLLALAQRPGCVVERKARKIEADNENYELLNMMHCDMEIFSAHGRWPVTISSFSAEMKTLRHGFREDLIKCDSKDIF